MAEPATPPSNGSRSVHAPGQSRRKRFIQGVTLGYVTQIVMLTVGMVLTPVLIPAVGHHEYGVWLITMQVLGYLSLIDIGVLAIFPREIAYAMAELKNGGGYRQIAKVFSEFRALMRWQALIGFIACACLWLLLPATWTSLRWPLAFFLGAFCIIFPLRIYSSLLYALQDQVFTTILGLGAWLCGTALTLVLIFRGDRLSALIAGWIFTQALVAVIAAIRVSMRFPEVTSFPPVPLTWKTAKKYLKQSSWLGTGQLAAVFLSGSDVAILGRTLGPSAVVPYAITAKLMAASRNLPSQLMYSAFPALAEARKSESKETLREVVVALVQLLLLVSGGLFCVVLSVNQGFVGRWMGERYFGGNVLTLIFLTDMLFRHSTIALSFALFTFGRERESITISLCDGFFTLGLSTLLCWGLGPVGVPLGSLLSACVIGLPFALGVVASELFTNVRLLVRPFYSWFWRLTFAAGGLFYGMKFWYPTTLVGVVVLGAAVGIGYLLLMRPVVSTGPLSKYCPPKFKRLFGSKVKSKA